jgi:hypothetical protein
MQIGLKLVIAIASLATIPTDPGQQFQVFWRPQANGGTGFSPGLGKRGDDGGAVSNEATQTIWSSWYPCAGPGEDDPRRASSANNLARFSCIGVLNRAKRWKTAVVTSRECLAPGQPGRLGLERGKTKTEIAAWQATLELSNVNPLGVARRINAQTHWLPEMDSCRRNDMRQAAVAARMHPP